MIDALESPPINHASGEYTDGVDTFPETDSEEYDNVDVSLQFTHEDEDYAVKKVEGKTYTQK